MIGSYEKQIFVSKTNVTTKESAIKLIILLLAICLNSTLWVQQCKAKARYSIHAAHYFCAVLLMLAIMPTQDYKDTIKYSYGVFSACLLLFQFIFGISIGINTFQLTVCLTGVLVWHMWHAITWFRLSADSHIQFNYLYIIPVVCLTFSMCYYRTGTGTSEEEKVRSFQLHDEKILIDLFGSSTQGVAIVSYDSASRLKPRFYNHKMCSIFNDTKMEENCLQIIEINDSGNRKSLISEQNKSGQLELTSLNEVIQRELPITHV